LERVAFLIEDTGERLGCLLNPEGILLRRQAGIQSRQCGGGLVTGSELADDPLFFSGGGHTDLTLDLLFDVSLAGSSVSSEDVRDLTGPLWDLAENRRQDTYGKPPLCRFVWGKSWNFPGVVSAVAERLESFTALGVPRRSWLRLRLLRALDPVVQPYQPVPAGELMSAVPSGGPRQTMMHEVVGGAAAQGGERMDQLAYRYYGDTALGPGLAAANNIDDPMHLPAGHLLEIPPLSVLLERWDAL
jgi:hypothetical protein